MNLRKAAAAVAVALAIGGVSGQAQADAFGGAIIDVTDFTIFRAGDTPVPLTLADFESLSFTDTLTNAAQLQGLFDPDPTNTAVAVGFAAATDATQACVTLVGGVPAPGVCVAGENDFTIFDEPEPDATFARSDSLLENQPIAGTGFPVGVHAGTVAETSLDTPLVFGSSNSTIALTAAFEFVLAEPAEEIIIAFDADAFLQAWTGADTAFPTQAGGSITWILSVTGPGVNILWMPDGTGSTAIGLTDVVEGCTLNSSTSAGPGQPNDPVVDCTDAAFSATAAGGFAASTPYSLRITQTVTSNALQAEQVPEPSSLLLLGLGLAGLGFARRYIKAA